MKSDTSKFKNVQIIYDNGDFAIASGIWDNKEAIGCRWYEEDGLGYPQTYGKPQWMLLPNEIGKLLETTFLLGKLAKNIS